MFYSAFYHVPHDLETKQLIAVLKIADPYSFSIMRFPLAQVRKEGKNSRAQKDVVYPTADIRLHILELSFRSTMSHG